MYQQLNLCGLGVNAHDYNIVWFFKYHCILVLYMPNKITYIHQAHMDTTNVHTYDNTLVGIQM